MNKEELQKMADEHFAANPKETKCYATSDGNVWMDRDKAFAQRHADSLKESAMEFIRMEKPLAPEPEVKKSAPKKAKEGSEPKTEESVKEEAKTEESVKEEAKTEESVKEEAKTEESVKEEAKTEESEKEEAKTEESEKPKKDLKKAVAPKVETPKAAPKKAAPVKTAKKK
jgi:hypothetical protein